MHTINNIEEVHKCIARAKDFLDETKTRFDPELAVFVLRDEPIVEEAGMKDLFWAMSRDGSPSRQDVLSAINDLEQYLEALVPRMTAAEALAEVERMSRMSLPPKTPTAKIIEQLERINEKLDELLIRKKENKC